MHIYIPCGLKVHFSSVFRVRKELAAARTLGCIVYKERSQPMALQPHISRVVIDFVVERMGIADNARERKEMEAVLSRIVPGQRSSTFTEHDGSTYAIVAVTPELLLVRDINSETEIDISRTRQLQARITAAVEEERLRLNPQRKVVLICYDIGRPDLRKQIEEIAVPKLQERLGADVLVTSEYNGPLAVQPGEMAYAAAEREASSADAVIMVLTAPYVASARFAQQSAIFPHMLRGKIVPIMFEQGLKLPAWLAMLEADDGIDIARLPGIIRRMLG